MTVHVPVQAQDTVYVSDKVFIVLHRGPGAEYRWVAKLTPGTRLQRARTSNDGEWAEVTTTRGTIGWVRNEFLSSESPAQVKLPAAQARAEKLGAENAELSAQLQTLRQEKVELLNRVNDPGSDLVEGSAYQFMSDLGSLLVSCVSMSPTVIVAH